MLKWRINSLVSFHPEDPCQEGSRTPLTTPETDVFEFGTLIMEVDTFGHLSRFANNMQSLRNRHLSGHLPPLRDAAAFNHNFESEPVRPQSLPGLSDGLWSVVLDCWLKEPEQRPNMAEVARRLVQLAHETARNTSWNMVSLQNSLPYTEDPQASSYALADISTEIRRLGEHPIAGGGHGDLFLGERLGSEKVALKLIRFFGASKQDPNAARRVSL